MREWKNLGEIDARALLDARLELRWAAQLPAMGIGRSLVEPRDDDSHTALEWKLDGWLSQGVEGLGHLQVGCAP